MNPMVWLAKTPYVTTRAWGIHPAGSTCEVSRESEEAPLIVEFSDGARFITALHYAQGVETPPRITIREYIMREIDAEVLAELDRCMLGP